jgi:hypothetical protein
MENEKQYPEWTYIKRFHWYFYQKNSTSEYMKLFMQPPFNGDERKFLIDSIKGLKLEKERLEKLFFENIDEIEKGLKAWDDAKEKGYPEEFDVYYRPDFVKTLKGFPYWSTVRLYQGKMIQSKIPTGDNGWQDVSYPTLIHELEYKLKNLPKSDSELRELINEATTGEENTTIKNKLQWMVELGIIDHLRDKYPAFTGSTNLMAEYVAKIIGEKQRTVQSYLNAHVKDTEPLNDPKKRDALIEKGIKRKRA